MTSSTTGDRRWGTTRRSGMTILGKVAVPKPINLPSQRLENQGLDPNVEIVPKGTLSWGSKSSLNAWGTSSVSPRTESGPGSPSHLSNRPSTGGSVTRPSTADSDKAHDSSSIAWDSNSRPSSASGVFPSNQASVGLQRPHSADTRPGISHLSRFAEPVSETSATWGQHGDVPTKKDGFSLTSGDFPTLGAEKESSEKSSMQQDAGRPASSSGRSVEEREANVRIGDDNAWRRDNQPYSEGAPRHCREEGQLESHCPQSYPNANFPHQYDGWRGPPVNNHQGGGWYRGNHPYGAPMGPRGFPVDPFPFYPPQVPPIPGHEAGPRGNHPANGQMFRPPILDSYVHPRMQTRPGFYLGPVPHESFYGPPMGYGSPGNRDLPFAGRPAGPHAYSQHPGQGGYDKSGSSVAVEQNEPSHSPERQRQYKVLLRPQDGRHGDDEAKREEFLGNRLPNAENVAQQMQTSQNNRRENSNEASDEVQPIKAENAAPEDPSLIQKIEGLNSKTRSHDGWQNASSVVNSDQLESKTRTFNSGNPGNKVSARMPRTGHASDSTNSLHYKHGEPATNKNAEVAAISGTSVSRRSSQQTQGGADHQPHQRVNNEGDSLDTGSIGKPVSGISVDPNDNQRATMRELARQRAQQRQKEEEERARDQRAKALAKLEELNRRSQVAEEGSAKNLEAASDSSIPDIPEVPRSLSPARMAAKSTESIEESGKPSMQNARTSTEDSDYMDPNQQDNLPRHRDAASSKQKRLGYNQKQHVVFEKKMAGNTFNEATTQVFDAVPSPEVSNQGVISQNSDMPATSSVSTEQAFTKRKNNRNGKKKHKVEETKLMNTTGAAVGKETKSGDESIEIGRVRVAEIKFGSLPVSSLDIKASGNSSDQISSSKNEESRSRAKTNSKSQHLRKTPRNSLANKPADKFPGNTTVVWAPVQPQQKPDISTVVGSQSTVPESSTSSKSLHQGQTNSRSKRVELERYVAKPIAKEIAEQTVSKDPITAAPEMAENVLQNENCGGEGTGILQRPGSTAGKSGSPLKSRYGNGRQGKHGRGSAASTKALDEDGLFGTSNQHIQGTVNHTSNQSGQIAVDSSKDHVLHTAVAPNVNRGGQSGGRQYSRDRTYASQRSDVAEHKHQGFTPEQKMTSADTPDHSQNRSASQEVQGGHNPNSMFQKNTGQNRRFGRGQEPHGGWGSSMQENMNHHHQRPLSNRGRQKPNVHYEYKPVGSHAYDGEQLNDSSEGPRYREKGQGNQRHGGQKSYQQQRGSAGRNAAHGLSDERN
ncbi:Protein MODIFIER OF SNC1 1 [Hirschfeldia incana]|nr:Protein MODIFIER OF SNC1 1 [Hirschfeldia incana]